MSAEGQSGIYLNNGKWTKWTDGVKVGEQIRVFLSSSFAFSSKGSLVQASTSKRCEHDSVCVCFFFETHFFQKTKSIEALSCSSFLLRRLPIWFLRVFIPKSCRKI
jgi:hypothetical protein